MNVQQNKQDFWRERRVDHGRNGNRGHVARRRSSSKAMHSSLRLVQDHNPQSELIRAGIIRQMSVVDGSLEDFASIERAVNLYEIDTVFHLGAQTVSAWQIATRCPRSRPTYAAHTICLRFAAYIGRWMQRVVVASSDKAYSQKSFPTRRTPLEGRHPYDVSARPHLPVLLPHSTCRWLLPGVATFMAAAIWIESHRAGHGNSLLLRQRPVLATATICGTISSVLDAVSAYLSLAEQLDEPGVCGEAFNFNARRPRRRDHDRRPHSTADGQR